MRIRRLRRGDLVTLGPNQPVGTVESRRGEVVLVRWPHLELPTQHEEHQLVRIEP